MSAAIEYRIRLSASDARARLMENVDQIDPSILSRLRGRGTRAFVCQFTGPIFRLWRRREFRHGFTQKLHGAIYDVDGHCIIQRSFQKGVLVRIYIVFSVVYVSVIVIVAIITLFSISRFSISAVFMPVLVVITMAIIVRESRSLAAREEQAMREFLDRLFGDVLIRSQAPHSIK